MRRPVLLLIALALAGACSSGGGRKDDPAASTSSSSTTPAAKGFDAQAYCVEKLTPLKAKYPKSLGGSDVAAECVKMIGQTDASSAKTIDALLEAAETYYKQVG